MPTVVVTGDVPQCGIDYLKSNGFDVHLWSGKLAPTRDELLNFVSGADGILSLLTNAIDAELLDAAGSRLSVVANFAVGFNNIDVAAAEKRGVQVGNTPDVLTDATADIAIALILAAARNFSAATANVRDHQWTTWEPLGFLGQTLAGKTLGIVGCGRIGQQTARRLHHGWGMTVLYTSRSNKFEFEAETSAEQVSLETLLERSDFVSVHCVLTDATRQLIGASEFDRMKSSAVLVNTARGEVIDQDALVTALRSKSIFAAGLDVTTPEPLPSDSPLRDLPNVIILPHIGSATFAARDAMSMIAAKNIVAGIAGKPIPHPVGK
jgi:lactate dehydrogenase-like 2-hydroxyacid dehydrogenase